MPASSQRVVRVAGISYRHPDGSDRLALRGDTVTLTADEEKRLDAHDALESKPARPTK